MTLIPQGRADLRQPNLHLRIVPPQNRSHQIQHIPLQPHLRRQLVEGAHLLHPLIRRPIPNRRDDRLRHHLGKSRLAHPPRKHIVIHNPQRPPRLVRALGKRPPPVMPDAAGGGVGVVVGANDDAAVHVLDPAAGLEAAVGFPVELHPVLDAAHHPADVNVVKGGFGKSPRLGEVVELEFAVGRHPGGLGGREVDADNLGGGVFVGEVARGQGQQLIPRQARGSGMDSHSPDARTGANIKNPLRILDRGEVEFVTQGEVDHVVAGKSFT